LHQEEEEFVIQWLANPSQDGFRVEGWFGPQLIASINAVHKMHKGGGIQSEKLKTLKKHLIDRRKQKWTDFRCIIFVKQRISAYILAQHLNNDKDCLDYGIKAD
jgi:superfamily II DNA/RNA helicase